MRIYSLQSACQSIRLSVRPSVGRSELYHLALLVITGSFCVSAAAQMLAWTFIIVPPYRPYPRVYSIASLFWNFLISRYLSLIRIREP